MGENAPASRGFVDSFLNPPTVTTQRIELRHTFPTEAFSYDFDLVKEALDEFNVEKYEPAKVLCYREECPESTISCHDRKSVDDYPTKHRHCSDIRNT
jgi:hypothetical protein